MNKCFEIKILKTRGCWFWLGRLNEDGYGVSDIKNEWKTTYAHRISFGFRYGFVPRELDHICRIRNCVNPKHLRPIVHRANVQIGMLGKTTSQRQLSKTHCPKGHPYSKENTYIAPRVYLQRGSNRNYDFYPKIPSRHCRICKKIAQKKYCMRKKNG